MKRAIMIVLAVLFVAAVAFVAIGESGALDLALLRAQADADAAAAARSRAEGERARAEGEADAIRAPAEAAAFTVRAMTVVMAVYGLLAPVALVATVLLAIVAGLCIGLVVAPRVRIWLKMRRLNYDDK